MEIVKEHYTSQYGESVLIHSGRLISKLGVEYLPTENIIDEFFVDEFRMYCRGLCEGYQLDTFVIDIYLEKFKKSDEVNFKKFLDEHFKNPTLNY